MRTLGIAQYDDWSKDVWLANGDVKVDFDDVDHAEVTALISLLNISPELLDICYDFVLKCHLGLAKSNDTYGRMKAALDKYHELAHYEGEEDD